MAIIVNKEEKRRKIALVCKEIVLENGIRNLSISKLAEAAGIGKGTIYEYFENKEDIILELVKTMMQKHNTQKEKRLLIANSTKEKVEIFLSFFYSDKDTELIKIYKEFISVSLSNQNKSITKFHAQCLKSYCEWFFEIIHSGIKKGELLPESKALVKGLYAVGEGLFIMNTTLNKPSFLKKDINEFINAIFKLIEVK